MTEIESASNIMVASPRFSPIEDGLDGLLFGPIPVQEYVDRFLFLNGGAEHF